MRLCYVSRECSPFTGGGIGTYVRNVIRAMRDHGHDVTLISDFLESTDAKRARTELEAEGIKVVIPRHLPEGLRNCYYHLDHEYADRVYREIVDLDAEAPFDAVEFPEFRAEGLTCIRAKRLLGEFQTTTLVVKCHTPRSLLFDINEQHWLAEMMVYEFWMEDYVVRLADRVTSPSRSLGEYFEKRLGVGSIPSCPYPMQLPTVSRDAETGNSIVFVGRIECRKGIDLLLRAAVPVLREHPDLFLDCYGGDTDTGPFETSMLEHVQRRVIPADLKPRIRFHGVIRYDEVLQRIASARVCVFPSRWENWPNVCLEAMSLGVPVVVSRFGGMGEMVVDGESGLAVDPNDIEALGDRIGRIVADPELARRLATNAEIRARELADPADCVRRIEKSYAPVPVGARPSTAQPKVSILVPFYNQAEWLREAVDSALASDYPDLELIVVDDGSTEAAAISEFDALADPRITKIRKDNGGLASARNAALAAATGEYVLPLDSDDRIDPGYVAAAVAALERNPDLAYVTCYVQNFDALDNHYVPLGFVREILLIANPAGKCTSMFRRQVLVDLEGYDEKMISFEDWDVLARLAATEWDGDVLPRSMFFYRRHMDSMVYQTALPKQVPLMQYMVEKNDRLRERYRDMLLRLTVGMWIESSSGLGDWKKEVDKWQTEAQRLAKCWEEQKNWIEELELGKLPWISRLFGVRRREEWLDDAQRWRQESRRLAKVWEEQNALIKQLEGKIAKLEAKVRRETRSEEQAR